MADEAFGMQGTSVSGAQGARISVGGTSTKQDGGALLRISQALDGLMGSLINSLEEFRDVGNTLELETAAGIVNGGPDESQTSESVEVRPKLLLVVASTLKEMVGTLVSGIKANAEVQTLLPAIQKSSGANHHAFFQDRMISKQPGDLSSCLVDIAPPSEEMPVCISNKISGMVKRDAVKAQVVCKHSCEHHPELVDPWLWRNLPQELVELVFAKLPLPRIIELCERSKAWSAMSKSSNFREACSKRHPKLFGLLGYDADFESTQIRIYDIESKEWLCMELAGFPGSLNSNSDYERDAYRNPMYACDGGLVCFAPQEHLTTSPILVCNPLTNNWKALPLLPLDDFETKKTVMVQLVMEDDEWYKVILVSFDKTNREAFSAHFYDSEDGVWSIMKSGLVYGIGWELLYGFGDPYVFDCSTKTLFDVKRCASLETLDPLTYSVANDRLFVLHRSVETGQRGQRGMYLVSKHKLELNRSDLSLSDLRKLDVLESPVQVFPDPYKVMLFASPGFVLVFADNCEDWPEDHHQLIGLYDVEEDDWDIPPPLPSGSNIHYAQLQTLFMCELRWNTTP